MIEYLLLIETQPQELEPDKWVTAIGGAVQLDRPIQESDVIQLKEQVASQVVFQKLPARLRIVWNDPQATGKIAGKQQNPERSLIMYDDFTFDSAQELLIASLEKAIATVRAEKPRHKAVPA